MVDRHTRDRTRRLRVVRSSAVLSLAVLALAQAPVVAAHDVTATGGLSRVHGTGLALIGIVILSGAIICKRTNRVSPTVALYGVFLGICLTILGTVFFDALSPDPTYTAGSIPFPRSWYQPLALLAGSAVTTVSFIVGWLRWPTRPRYTFFGILLGLWISYPYLVPGAASDSHPLGYVIVLVTPVLVGYIIWTDVGDVLRVVLRDPVARRFGSSVGLVIGLFFLTITGYLSFFPEAGAPHEIVVTVLPVTYQLVTWPTLEIYLPHVPLFLAVSPGHLLIVGTLSALIGLNAAVIARHWRVEERAGLAQGTAGSAAVVGACTCGCCGPLVAKIAVLAAGPAIAAPLYWVFVDTASPLSALFIVGSLLLFAGGLVHSVEAAREPDGSTSTALSD